MRHYSDFVVNQQNALVPGATVSVFLAGTQSLAIIYSDDGITPKTNPITADTLGRFDFYVADGRYDLQVSGPTLSTVTIPNVEIADLTKSSSSDTEWQTFGVEFQNQTVNPVPPSGFVNLYSKEDKNLYFKDDTGREVSVAGGGGAPASPTNSLQKNSAGSFAASSISDDGSRVAVDEDARFKGPNPNVDVRSFGARSISGAIPQTTASCTSGQPTVTLAAASTFQNGDGVWLNNCGNAATVSTPGAPTVTPGQSREFTVPDALIASDTAGTSTYTYALVTRDINGGLSAVSPSTVITNGASALGQQTLTISSISLAQSLGTFNTNSLTVVTTTNHGLVANTLVHITGTTVANLKGWYQVVSIPNATTFVANLAPLLDTLSDTTGTVTYFKGNQVTFTNPANGYETYICAQRPGDANLKVIGVTFPFINNLRASTTFTDWGSTVTTKPNLPPYVTDSICTGTGQNDPLVTTIVSGAGTTSLTLSANAGNTTSGQTILYDDGSAFASAKSFINSNGGVLLIPVGTFHINSKQSLAGIPVRQEGSLVLGEPLNVTKRWTGSFTASSCPQFSYGCYPSVTLSGAWPGFDSGTTAFNSGELSHITFISTGNATLQWLVNAGSFQVDHLNFNTGSTGDYTGIAVAFVGGTFDFQFGPHINVLGGPGTQGGGFRDTTWAPQIYGAPTSTTGLGTSRFRAIEITPRGIYDSCIGGASGCGAEDIEGLYSQGPILPPFTVYKSAGGSNPLIRSVVVDTAETPYFLNLPQYNNGNAARVFSCAGQQGSGGLGIQGGWGALVTDCPTGNLKSVSPAPITSQGAVIDGIFNTGAQASSGQNTLTKYQSPLATSRFYPIYVEGTTPAAPTGSVVAGGSVPIGNHTYIVRAVYQNGAEGAASPASATITTTSGNQQVNLSWTALNDGCKGYNIYRDFSRLNGTIPIVAGCSSNSFSDTGIVAGGGNAATFSAGGPTMLMPGTQGIATPQVKTVGLTASGDVSVSGALIAPAIGPFSLNQHTIPATSPDTFVLQTATQSLLNKTLTSPILNGPVINSPVSGNAGLLTAPLAVNNISPGTDGQCLETSGTTALWGSCTGTLGVQTVSANFGGAVANTATTGLQNLSSFSPGFSAGQLNALGKTIRVTVTGNYTELNASQTLDFYLSLQGGTSLSVRLPASNPAGTAGGHTLTWLCMVTTAGSSGFMSCGVSGLAAAGNNSFAIGNTTNLIQGLNLTSAVSVVSKAAFAVTGSTSNTVNESWMLVEQLN